MKLESGGLKALTPWATWRMERLETRRVIVNKKRATVRIENVKCLLTEWTWTLNWIIYCRSLCMSADHYELCKCQWLLNPENSPVEPCTAKSQLAHHNHIGCFTGATFLSWKRNIDEHYLLFTVKRTLILESQVAKGSSLKLIHTLCQKLQVTDKVDEWGFDLTVKLGTAHASMTLIRWQNMGKVKENSRMCIKNTFKLLGVILSLKEWYWYITTKHSLVSDLWLTRLYTSKYAMNTMVSIANFPIRVKRLLTHRFKCY